MASREEIQKRLIELKVRRAVEKARASREASGQRFAPGTDPTEGMSSFDKFHTGLWSGFSRGGKGLINLALPDQLTPEFASDAALAKQDHEDAALRDTGWGATGALAGEIASTLPIGGGAGTLAKAGAGGGRLLKMATSLPARGALEGAVTAAATASPESRGDAASTGGVIGGGLGVAGKVLGRLGTGLAQRSGEADNLTFMAAQHGEKPFIPLAQAVGDESDTLSRLTRTLYRDALPYVPGVSGQMKAQGGRLGQAFRRVAMKEADSVDPANKVLTPALLRNPDAAIPELRKAVSKGFDDSVGSMTYSLKPRAVIEGTIGAQLQRTFKHIDPTTKARTIKAATDIIDRYSGGTTSIHGKNFLNAKNEINDLISVSKGPEKAALIEARNMIDREIKRQTPAAKYELFERSQAAHMDVLGLEKAFAKSDEFTPSMLRRSTNPKSGNRQVARTFDRVLKRSVGTPSAEGRRMGQIATGVGAVTGGIIPTLLAVGGANAIARPGVQTALMGQTATQQYLANVLRRNPEASRILGSAARAAATTQVD